MNKKVKVSGKAFRGEVIKYLPNNKVHINVTSTENTEWQRDLERGYPVLISVKLDEISFD